METCDNLRRIIHQGAPWILDGGISTWLEECGHDISDRMWATSLLRLAPEAVAKAQREFKSAGAQILTTATYQMYDARSFPTATSGATSAPASDIDVIAGNGLKAAQSALDDDADDNTSLVAFSLGPFGAVFRPGGEYQGNYGVTEDVLAAFHRPRVAAAVRAGARFFAFETIPSLAEADLLVAVLQEECPDASCWVSFSTGPSAGANAEGTSLAECARRLSSFRNIAALGVNCCPPNLIEPAIQALQTMSALPIIVYPNCGESWDAQTRTWQGQRLSPAEFAATASRWWRLGASIVGGCCRCTPSHIRALAARQISF